MEIVQDAENMHEVSQDVLLLLKRSERRPCLSVRSPIVALTGNDSVDLAQTQFSLTLLSLMCTNAFRFM